MAHVSDSSEQRTAERLILDQVESRIGVSLQSRRLLLGSGTSVEVNGVAADESVLVEVSAHHGPLKGGQRHKIASDILKLVTIAHGRHPRPRLVLAFADTEAASWSAGKSWLATAQRAWQVEVMVVALSDDLHRRIVAAQRRQVMVNPSDGVASAT
jgi:hypothetical protein